jgi:hypothetical protein
MKFVTPNKFADTDAAASPGALAWRYWQPHVEPA